MICRYSLTLSSPWIREVVPWVTISYWMFLYLFLFMVLLVPVMFPGDLQQLFEVFIQ